MRPVGSGSGACSAALLLPLIRLASELQSLRRRVARNRLNKVANGWRITSRYDLVQSPKPQLGGEEEGPWRVVSGPRKNM